MRLLEGVSDAELHAKGIEALRRWRKKPLLKPPHPYGPGYNAPPAPPPDPLDVSPNDVFSMHGDLGIELVKLLAEAKGFPNPDTQRLKEVFIDPDAMRKEWSRPVLEFVWWLGRTGLAVEIQHEQSTPILLRLTRRGAYMLDSTDDNPMLPGFLDRVRARWPKLPDGVIALLVDARACLDHSLLRPAVVLMGVAYELAIEEVVGELVTKGLVQPNTPKELPAKRIERIKELIRDTGKVKVVLPDVDDRTAALAAYDFADLLRLRRNEAAHSRPAYDFEHVGETEEFLVSAARHLPGISSLLADEA
jgi:hypothetical protein